LKYTIIRRERMRRLNFTTIFHVLFFLLISFSTPFASDADKALQAAEKLVNNWKTFLTQDHNLVRYHDIDLYWFCKRAQLYNNSLEYDVRRTDSLVSPYKLIISFEFTQLENREGPNAYAKGGYRTAKDALHHTTLNDYKLIKYSHGDPMIWNCTAYYAFQENKWIYKDGDDNFFIRFGMFIKHEENNKYFMNLLQVDAK
jgi:hypothetical protein